MCVKIVKMSINVHFFLLNDNHIRFISQLVPIHQFPFDMYVMTCVAGKRTKTNGWKYEFVSKHYCFFLFQAFCII